METREWNKLWYHPQLNIESYQAVCIKRGFPLHMHDYFVICLIEEGMQKFIHRKINYLTPPGGLIILNPEDAHTGEPADEYGFEYRALYPTVAHMQEAIHELTGKWQNPPYFSRVRIDDAELSAAVRALHVSLITETLPIERETLFLTVITKLVTQYAHQHLTPLAPKKERAAINKACCFIHDHVSKGITLTGLANHVGLSRYYFLRVFREEMGMPPYTYLESVRISRAKQLLEKGATLTDAAMELGFSDQSHFTNCFKRFIGITPGQYALEIKK